MTKNLHLETQTSQIYHRAFEAGVKLGGFENPAVFSSLLSIAAWPANAADAFL